MKTTLYRRNPKIVFHSWEDEIYLLDEKKDEIIKLNETGKVVWEKLAKPQSLENLVNFLCGIYEGDKKLIKEDIKKLLTFLSKRKIIQQNHPEIIR